MKNLLKISGLGILFLLLSCKEETARKPISYSSGEFIKESVTRNKELVNSEEEMIKNLIKKILLISTTSLQVGFGINISKLTYRIL